MPTLTSIGTLLRFLSATWRTALSSVKLILSPANMASLASSTPLSRAVATHIRGYFHCLFRFTKIEEELHNLIVDSILTVIHKKGPL